MTALYRGTQYDIAAGRSSAVFLIVIVPLPAFYAREFLFLHRYIVSLG
jgi:hypothetical protein